MAWWERSSSALASLLAGVAAPTLIALLGMPSATNFVLFGIALALVILAQLLRYLRTVKAEDARSRRIASYSDSYAGDIGRNFTGRLYVEREIEARVLLDALAADGPLTQIVSGEAGAGKTSMLWHLHELLRDDHPDVDVRLVSATWFVSDGGVEAAVTAEELVADFRKIPGHQPGVLLLDTVDVLLHSDQSRMQVLDLVRDLNAAAIRVVLATRPEEREAAIPPQMGKLVPVGRYSEHELTVAARSLAEHFCPTADAGAVVEDVVRATARGLPVREVCERPLLVRMLFELSAPRPPHLLEMDVTTLYRRYWEDRVCSDRRLGTLAGTGSRSADDVSAHAGSLALVMLAIGNPDAPEDVASERGAREYKAAGGERDIPFRDGLDMLQQRGVVARKNASLRFFHQTMFEFAAAKGIIRRGRESDVRQISERVLSTPSDLFVASVLQQLVMLVADDPLEESACRSVVVELLESGSAALGAIGCAVMASHPRLIEPRLDLVEELSSQQKGRLVELIASTHRPTFEDVRPLIEAIWRAADRPVRLSIVRAMRRFIETYGDPATACARALGIIEHFTLREQPALGDPDLMLLLPRVTRAGVQEDTGRVVGMLQALDRRGRHLAIEQLGLLAQNWEQCGSAELLEAIEVSVDALFARTSTDARSISRAMAELRFSAARRSRTVPSVARGWATVLATPDDGRASWRGGADLFAAVYACVESRDPAFIETVVSQVLQASPFDRPKLIATHFLAPLASTTGSVAAAIVGERLRRLAAALPIEPNEARTSDQQWAVVARMVLEDEQLLPAHVVAIAGPLGADRPALWTQRAGLVSVLAAAAVGGEASARQTLVTVASDPLTLDDGARTKFLNEAKRHLEDTLVTSAFASVAVQDSAYGHLTSAARTGAAAVSLEQFVPRLDELIRSGIRGKPKQQRLAANLWVACAESGIITVASTELIDAFDQMRSARARRTILAVLPSSLEHHPEATQAALDRLLRLGALDARPAVSASDAQGTAEDIALLEDGRDEAVLALECTSQPPLLSDWARIMRLAQRRRPGKQAVRLDSFRSVNKYLTRLARVDDALAAERLIDVGRTVDAPLFSVAQQQQIAYHLSFAIRTTVAEASTDSLAALANCLPEVPYKFGQALIRGLSQYRRRDALPHLRRVASTPGLHAETSTYLALNLHESSREIGLQTFPEILSS